MITFVETQSDTLPPLPFAGEGRGEGLSCTDLLQEAITHRRSTRRTRELRRYTTEAEKLVWKHIRDRKIENCKFKRQFAIGSYIADFACLEMNLVLEIDGGQHNESKADEARSRFLNSQGYEVVRFWNNDVLNNIQGVVQSLTLTLSRKQERELKMKGTIDND